MVLGLTAISGLLQGGGFGVGYGFGVRLGYDAYGAVKNSLFKDPQDIQKAKEGATSARYSTSPFMSHFGSGILMALEGKGL